MGILDGPPVVCRTWSGAMASYPSGQRDLTVNQTAQHSGVRIPHSPRMKPRFAGAFVVSGASRGPGGRSVVGMSEREASVENPSVESSPEAMSAASGAGAVGASGSSVAPADLLQMARRIAVQAAEFALAARRVGVAVAATKSTPTDIVTATDRETETLIRS